MQSLDGSGQDLAFWLSRRQSLERAYKALNSDERRDIERRIQPSFNEVRDCLESEVRPENGFDKALHRELQRLRLEEMARRKLSESDAENRPTEEPANFHPGMVWIPPGEITLGVERGFASREESKRSVVVDGFWIDTVAVTNYQYHQLYRTHKPDSHSLQDDMPVVGVTWFDAAKFAAAIGKRLPTGPEWERAARGPMGYLYSRGNSFDSAQTHIWPSEGASSVTAYPPNGWGVYQMNGNVWEWTADLFANQHNHGERVCYNMARGGSWRHCLWGARATMSICLDLGFRGDTVGFRCVTSL